MIRHGPSENGDWISLAIETQRKKERKKERKKKYLIGIGRLVVQRETDRVGERPFEEGIIFTGEDFDVNRHVRSFTRSVAIEEQRSLKPHPSNKSKFNINRQRMHRVTTPLPHWRYLPAACSRTGWCRKERWSARILPWWWLRWSWCRRRWCATGKCPCSWSRCAIRSSAVPTAAAAA